MSRVAITIHGQREREKLFRLIAEAPDLTRVTIQDPKRSLPQNSRMWVLLERISSALLWHGQHYPAEAWKDYFMHAYRGEMWMPAEEGGMVPIGRSTSSLSRDEHSELQTLIEAFCARQGIDLGDKDAET